MVCISILSIYEAFEKWVKIIDCLPDYIVQERFLRQYYNAFRLKSEIKVKPYSVATKPNIIKIYESLIGKNVKLIFDELIEKAKIYNKLISPEQGDGFYKELSDLINLGAAPSNKITC